MILFGVVFHVIGIWALPSHNFKQHIPAQNSSQEGSTVQRAIEDCRIMACTPLRSLSQIALVTSRHLKFILFCYPDKCSPCKILPFVPVTCKNNSLQKKKKISLISNDLQLTKKRGIYVIRVGKLSLVSLVRAKQMLAFSSNASL